MTGLTGADSELDATADVGSDGEPDHSAGSQLWSSQRPRSRRDATQIAANGGVSGGAAQADSPLPVPKGSSEPLKASSSAATATPDQTATASSGDSVVSRGTNAATFGTPPGAVPPASGLGSLVDPHTVAQWAPVAATVAGAGLSALPLLAEALSGLSNPGATATSPTSTPASGAPATSANNVAADAASGAGLSPQAQKAVQILKLLAAAYGSGTTTDPQVAALRQQLGIPATGPSGSSSAAATSLAAQQAYQNNAATAYTNLDNQLATDLTTLAGVTATDHATITNIISQVNQALYQLGPQAYTPAGQQSVYKILNIALTKAAATTHNTHTTSQALAQAVNDLTDQYLYTLAGKSNPNATGASPAAQKAISVAMAQVGKPYVMGGAGPDNFDCSGLVQYALAAAGVKAPRVATDQYNAFPKVAPSAIRPGDLIFPTDEINSSTGFVGHVMIYLGGGECIAASNPSVPVGKVPLPGSFQAARWT